MMLRNFIIIVWFGLILVQLSCSSSKENKIPPVAKVDNYEIRWKELKRSFVLDPVWVKGQTFKEAFLEQLDYVIALYIMADEAQKEKLDTLSSVREKIQFIKEKEMVKALYDKHIRSKVKIPEKELLQAYIFSRKKVQLEFVRTPDINRANKYKQLLDEKSVNEIKLLNALQDRKGISPMLTYGDVAEEIENVIFNLQYLEVTDPIEIDGYYYVFKLVDGEIQKFASQMDFAQEKSRLNRIIYSRKAKVFEKQYINKLMDGVKIHINREPFEILARAFMDNARKSTGSPIENPVSLAEVEKVQADISAVFNKPLVEYDGKQMTVAQFLHKLEIMPSRVRPPVHKPVLLRDAIVKLIQHEYLTRQAEKEGLADNEVVEFETQWQRRDVLADTYISRIRQQITVSDSLIDSFVKSERFNRLEKVLGKKPDRSAVENYLRGKIFADRMVELVDSLKQFHTVRIDTLELLKYIKKPEKEINYDPVLFQYKELYF